MLVVIRKKYDLYPKSNLSISDNQGNLFTKCLRQCQSRALAIYIYWEWSFTSISSLNPCFFTAHCICTIKAYKSWSWYVSTSLWQYFNFFYNRVGFCGRDWLQRQKIKTKWLWIFVKITHMFRSFIWLQLRLLHLQTKQYPEDDKPFCFRALWSRYSVIKERSYSYLKIHKSHFFACI